MPLFSVPCEEASSWMTAKPEVLSLFPAIIVWISLTVKETLRVELEFKKVHLFFSRGHSRDVATLEYILRDIVTLSRNTSFPSVRQKRVGGGNVVHFPTHYKAEEKCIQTQSCLVFRMYSWQEESAPSSFEAWIISVCRIVLQADIRAYPIRSYE